MSRMSSEHIAINLNISLHKIYVTDLIFVLKHVKMKSTLFNIQKRKIFITGFKVAFWDMNKRLLLSLMSH